MIIYLDTSALIKRYIQEAGSRDLQAWIKAADSAGTSIVTQVEAASVFSRAARLGELDWALADRFWQDFLYDVKKMAILEVDANLILHASQAAWDYGLRGYDAFHLASARRWQDLVREPVTMVTFDRRLWEAGKQAGMALLPEVLA